MRWAGAVVAAFLVVVAGLVLGLFIVQNSAHTAELSLELPFPARRWLFLDPATGQAPSVLLLMGLSFLGGLGFGLVLVGFQWMRGQRQVRLLRQQIGQRSPRVPSLGLSEPVTNVETPLRTTANRALERLVTSDDIDDIDDNDDENDEAKADPDTQTRNW